MRSRCPRVGRTEGGRDGERERGRGKEMREGRQTTSHTKTGREGGRQGGREGKDVPLVSHRSSTSILVLGRRGRWTVC